MKNEGQFSITEIKQQLKGQLSSITNSERTGIAKVLQLDLLKELANNLKARDSITESQWKKTIAKLKNYKKYIKIDGDKFIAFITMLLPLLGAYLGCMFTFKKNRQNDIDAGVPLIKKSGTNEFTETSEEVVEVMKSLLPEDPDTISYIPDWCKEEKNKFSYYIKTDYNDEKSSSGDDCNISMCPPESSSDTSALAALSPLRDSRGIVVEYDSRYSHKVNVQVGSVISFNENLGHINNLQVKSQVRGLVVKKTKDYFIADYLDEVPEIDADKLIEKYSNSAMEEICDLFNNNANVTNFIKDYLLETRMPALANHLLGAGSKASYERYLKKYRKKGRDILDKYEKQIKQDCSKPNVEAYGKASKLHKLKEKLDDNKKKAFDQIFDLYNNYKGIGYCSKGRIADFMLYDEYIDFLLDEEKFRYDDKNPYVVEMFKLLCKFVGTRSKLEKNMDNLPNLKAKFNKLCKQTLKSHWKPRNNDYYTEMKSIFRYDYYTNDTEQLIEALVTDKDAVSLYSKVYDYLKALCHYTTPEGTTIQYTDEMDVKALLKSNQEDKTDRTMDENLRKIAYNFCLLRNVETSANDESVYDSIANEAIVLAFYYLDLESGIFIEEYYDGYVGADPIVLAAQAILRPYLKTLKEITQNEEYEMNKLAKKAIEWYTQNGEKVNDPHIFDQFKEIPWGATSRIVYNNDYYDYVFLKYKVNDSDSMMKAVEDEPFDFDAGNEDDDYYETLACVKTKFDICSFPYWQRYLTIATLVNCMMPIYWGTGLIILGAPIILPIIMLPIFVLPGRVTVVFGIGLCGICPMPLILFVNMGNTKGSILIPLNIMADVLKASLKQVTNSQKKVVDLSFAPLIMNLDAQINQYNSELDDLENQIHNIDSFIKSNKKLLRNIKKRKKEDPTTQSK